MRFEESMTPLLLLLLFALLLPLLFPLPLPKARGGPGRGASALDFALA